jgi:hypothetical protein
LPQGKWVGFKTVKYVAADGVHLEMYYDMTGTGKSWTKAASIVDTGDSGPIKGCQGGCTCTGCDCSKPVTWGGPAVNFRWDQMNSMKIR